LEAVLSVGRLKSAGSGVVWSQTCVVAGAALDQGLPADGMLDGFP